ncbi:hypothetical protein Tco_0745144 [Tanacetum coccineum]
MIREYVKEFTILILEILNLSDQDSLFYFLDGLQGWAKTELERLGVQDLATAIAHAESLINFSTRRDSSKPKDQKVGLIKNHKKTIKSGANTDHENQEELLKPEVIEEVTSLSPFPFITSPRAILAFLESYL